MPKLRRNNNCFSPRNKIKPSSTNFSELCPNEKLKLSKSKVRNRKTS